jgi:hypothetical protein
VYAKWVIDETINVGSGFTLQDAFTLVRASITLEGCATIGLSSGSTGSLFIVEDKVTLTLGDNITLQGYDGNTGPLVHVDGGTLVMKDGSTITGNKATYNGGAVFVHSGTFFMSDGVHQRQYRQDPRQRGVCSPALSPA